MEGRGAWRARIFSPDQRHKGRDTEELQKAVVERPVGYIIGSQQQVSPNCREPEQKVVRGSLSNMVGWFGKVHHGGGE